MPYFFAQEDELAEVLILWGQMNERARAELLLAARTLVTP